MSPPSLTPPSSPLLAPLRLQVVPSDDSQGLEADTPATGQLCGPQKPLHLSFIICEDRGAVSRLDCPSLALSRCSINVSPVNAVSFDYRSVDYASHAPNLPLLKNPSRLPEEHAAPTRARRPSRPLSTLCQASSSRPTAFAYAVPSARNALPGAVCPSSRGG